MNKLVAPIWFEISQMDPMLTIQIGTQINWCFCPRDLGLCDALQSDSCRWWITDPQESGLIKVSFAPTEDNLSDIGTKNVTGDVFDRVRPESMIERPKDV